jgi:cell division protein FtsQ
MTVRVKWGLGVAGAVLVLSTLAVVFGQVPFFRVRQIEVIGVRYLAPNAIISAAQLEIDQNLFDPVGRIEDRLRAVPGIVGAEVSRRLPGTLRISVQERLPVAVVPGPDGMITLDRAAQPLPFDPAQSEIDLPVVRSADSMLTSALGSVVATDPDLYATIQSVEAGMGGVILTLREGRVLLNANPTLEEIRSLGAIWRHVIESGRSFGELDGRFAGMVILRESTG